MSNRKPGPGEGARTGRFHRPRVTETAGYVQSQRTPGILHIRVMDPRADPWLPPPPGAKPTLRN